MLTGGTYFFNFGFISLQECSLHKLVFCFYPDKPASCLNYLLI